MFSRKRIDSKKPCKLSMNTLLGLRIIVTFWKYYVSKLFTGSEYNKYLYNFKGYSHIYKLRNKKRGGGVYMFINNKLNFQVRKDITFNLKTIDLIAIEY